MLSMYYLKVLLPRRRPTPPKQEHAGSDGEELFTTTRIKQEGPSQDTAERGGQGREWHSHVSDGRQYLYQEEFEMIDDRMWLQKRSVVSVTL